MTLTAVVADDSVLLREGICRLLEDESITVLGQAGDGTALLDLVATHRPNIAIVDIRMPPDYRTEGLKAAAAIRSTFPATSVLLLSQYLDTENALDLLRNDTGGVGYLLKDRVTDIDTFVATVRRVAAGDTALDPELISAILGRPRRIRQPIDDLTVRERDVLQLMAQGETNRGIASMLFMGERTVEAHVSTIFTKLGLPPDQRAHRRVLAVLTYLRSTENHAARP